MAGDGRRRQRDLSIRVLGIGLLVLGAVATHHLRGIVPGALRQEATLGEMAVAAAAFIGFSLGAALTLLGAHIHDEIEIAERWRRRFP